MLPQRTIKTSVSARGVTLHSGVTSTITLKPADVDTGIVFCRLDCERQQVQALNEYVGDVTLCTGLQKNGIKISTVEHLLSALSALGIDNLMIELDSDEVPIMDGSASPFIFLLESAGLQEQDAYKKFFVIKQAVSVSYGDSWARLKPHVGFKVSVEIDFQHKKIKESGQKLSLDFAKESYLKEIMFNTRTGNTHRIHFLKRIRANYRH